MNRYWHVEFYDPKTNNLEHNAICKGFDEIASISQGRVFAITGEATLQEYLESKEEI